MKEIISAVLVVVGIWGGTRVLADLYEGVRKAALEKAAQGLPSLGKMNHQLHRTSKSVRANRTDKQAPDKEN